MRAQLYCFVVLVTTFLFSAVSQATLVLPSTLKYMTDFSDAIVIGYVTDKYSYWDNDKIYTNVIINLDQYVKYLYGEKSQHLQIKILGGKVDDVRLEVSDAPTFELGEKVMLFLKKFGDHYFPYGIYYGVYRISYSEEEGKEFIDGPLLNSPQLHDLKSMKKMANPEPLGRRELKLFLDDVKKIIR